MRGLTGVLGVWVWWQVAGKRPVIVLNHRFSQPPLEMSIFTEAYHLHIWKIKRQRPEPSYPLPSRHDELSPRMEEPTGKHEVETVLIRKFPYPWQVRPGP
jgi:hypothetical protein